jgi:hypothetical protein
MHLGKERIAVGRKKGSNKKLLVFDTGMMRLADLTMIDGRSKSSVAGGW